LDDDLYRAVMIAEGALPAKTEEEFFGAWQALVDSGLAWKLQGFFGRTARDLIEAGLICPPPTRTRAENPVGKEPQKPAPAAGPDGENAREMGPGSRPTPPAEEG
jgi:hypothetical protein